ncbi:MAG: hypothetical protein ACTSUG_13935 [Candidatus Helarchaeota archaeon]
MIKKIIFSLALFVIVFIAIGLPYKNWWFDEGSYTLLLNQGYRTKSWKLKDYFHFFYHGHTDQVLGKNNKKSDSFAHTAYRPFYSIFAAIQYRLFGTNAHYYLLSNTFFHSINTVLLFIILLYFINYFLSFLISLIFAFHPLIGYRFGPVEFLHIYINLTLILLIFIFFKKYLDSKKWIYNFFACLLFLISLLNREVSVVLPIILFAGTYLYPCASKDKKLLQAAKSTIGFWIIVLGFFSLRIYLHPKVAPIFTQLKNRLFSFHISEIKAFVTDVFGLTWIPNNYFLIKITIIFFVFSLFLWLFIKNTKKIYIIYFLSSAFILLWPSYIRSYVPRYLYEVYPFILIAFVLCFKYYKNQNLFYQKPLYKKIGIFSLIFIVLFFITFTTTTFSKRAKIHSIKKTATKHLINNPKIKNRALYFLATPLHYFSGGYNELLWIMLDDTSIIIYFDLFTQSQLSLKHLPRWKLPNQPYPTKNYINIKPIKNGLNFTTTNPTKISFQNYPICRLGKKIIHNTKVVLRNTVITDFDIIFNKKHLDNNPLFITWNYEKAEFKILN